MEKNYEAGFCSKEHSTTTLHLLSSNNQRLKKTLKAMLIMLVVLSIGVVAFVYHTIQLSKERDLLQHLEQKMHDYEQHSNPVTKRALLWYIGAAAWTVNQIYSFWSLATACKEFHSGTSNQIQCVYGAVATAVTFIAAAKNGASTVKIIHDRLAQNGIQIGNWKRDEIVTDVEGQMSDLFGRPVTLDGFMPHHHPKLARLNLANGTHWPVFHMHNHHNTSMHFTMTAYEQDHAVMSLGFGHKRGEGSAAKREVYSDEYFTSGGLDFTDCYNDGQQHYLLNKDADFQQMDKEVECYMPDLKNAWGMQFQVYDQNAKGTIASGSVAPFRGSDHASSIGDMPGCPNTIPSSDKCRIS
ncbi:uncharacterized protein K452DRAFT_291665 [Aplosporella prunicola CBS 121167]|uniref:Uncharacterized protein n=1 Tax=Aplosporella prunicola CBS 121167 TaxID=1176127 RepID=A0A6A6B224_9PEZI|nr:uncharacterized protein K452DRAFT_291665 [Aplosporella prunicola CBS 121167]KAF2137423.1 hypothetical protein K452DRAFT_291665 [Aplosporella prunicola CBS 121167]